jgi:hypothetical protein
MHIDPRFDIAPKRNWALIFIVSFALAFVGLGVVSSIASDIGDQSCGGG